MFKKIFYFIFSIFVLIGFYLSIPTLQSTGNYLSNYKDKVLSYSVPNAEEGKDLSAIDYTSHDKFKVNNNKAQFSDADLSIKKGDWQEFANLDNLNRPQQANAMMSKTSMPSKKREQLIWNPTGFHQKKIGDKSDSGWLYDRSHLIGYQLTGQNNNPKNLITGTRHLNVDLMEPWENKIADYLRTHPKNHVRYRVTPIFRGNEIVARGVQLEAQSIETNDLNFNLYLLNIQVGVNIDYSTGYSQVI